MSIGHLTGKCWLDENGRNVWFEHYCGDMLKTSMLPKPKWHVAEDGRTVTPSIHCTTCGFHEIMILSDPPQRGAKP